MQRVGWALGLAVLTAVGCGDDGGSKPGGVQGDATAPAVDDGVGGEVPEPDAAPGGVDAATGGTPTPPDAEPEDADTPPPDVGPVDDAAPPADAGPVDDAAPMPDMRPPMPGDDDGDGFTGDDGDCNDDDADVYPGATEVCDAVDNDCDGEADGIVVSCFDGEPALVGVGACLPGTSECLAGEFAACTGQSLPVAEVCDDRIDNDCDGIADEGCDADDDGFTGVEGDCDDANPDVNPDAAEVCNGLDDDCDGETDGVREPCYDGPQGTQGLGICAGGERLCVGGGFGDCQGQVLPAAGESCENAADDDCDGSADEGCEVLDPACAQIDLDSPVTVTAECLATGSGGQGLVLVELRDTQGQPLLGRTVDIQFQPALPLVFRNVLSNGGTYFRGYNPTDLPQETYAVVSVACGASRVALRTQPRVQIVPGTTPGRSLVTGGCTGLTGDLRALVTDAESGALIPNAWLMVGVAPENRLQDNATDFVRGVQGGRPNSVNAQDGRPRLLDYGGRLTGPVTLTVGADGYENVTLADLNASMVTVPLRPVAPPPPARVTLEGRLADFDSLRVDGDIDAGLVLGGFDLSFLTSFNVGSLLGRQQCWDPLQEGLAADLVPETLLPGNLYVPRQRERIEILPITVSEHRFSLSPFTVGTDNLTALAGKVSSDALVEALAAEGASLNGLLSLLSLREIGVARDQRIEADTLDLAIPLSQPLRENASCQVSNPPPGTSVSCVSAGDWSGGAGAGPLFAMGFGTVDAADLAVANGPVGAPLTTVARDGVFRGIGYIGAAVARFLDYEAAPPELAFGLSTIIDRGALGPDGGAVVADSFLDVPSLARDDLDVNWGAVENATSPPVDLCRVEIVRGIAALYQPGACVPELATIEEQPLWTGYVRGDPGTLRLPSLPNAWPRSAQDGLLDLGVTPEEDFIFLRLSCLGLGAAPNFDYDRADFRALVEGVTHFAQNQASY